MPDTIVLKPVPESVKAARDAISFAAAEWGIDDHVPRLVVSELVTNALRVSSPDDHIVVRAYQVAGKHYIEVWDTSAEMPTPQCPDNTTESGRGLLLLGLLVKRWGVRPLADHGKAVYAELNP